MKDSWRSCLIALRQKVVLTREELRVIIFIVTALVLGLSARYYRDLHPPLRVDKKHLSSRVKENSASPSSLPKRTKPDAGKQK